MFTKERVSVYPEGVPSGQNRLCFFKMFPSGVHVLNVHKNGTGIDKVKVNSNMASSQNNSARFHTKKQSNDVVSFPLHCFCTIWYA